MTIFTRFFRGRPFGKLSRVFLPMITTFPEVVVLKISYPPDAHQQFIIFSDSPVGIYSYDQIHLLILLFSVPVYWSCRINQNREYD